ncbi:MAG: 16S rRNA (cytosine(1402)-N(4))-methyltransferase RsmH [Candidatus Parcubacteria bacterium]|nr:16S rRNA (cytosine(1402)-N(4))-methyltransferase RsmH [Candidatus Parcubacteria bacterium]
MEFKHKSVLAKEVIQYLAPQPNENFVDCTLGGGGHAEAILNLTGPSGKLLGIDLDPEAIKAAQSKLQSYGDRAVFINDNFKNLKRIIYDAGFNKINGILLDLGISSFELEDKTRGFSFRGSSFLDMRFGATEKTAAYIINQYKEENLTRIFKDYGEERYAKLIARAIINERKIQPISTTEQLVKIIEKVYQHKPKLKIHPATKVFQALRIEVNHELENLQEILPQALELLVKGGRIVVISFHSLEDRIVKDFFRQEAKDCICPPKVPVCTCNHQPKIKILTKKIIIPSNNEITENFRSRSAKLRAAVKIA